MSDTVIVALIAAIPASLGFILGVINRGKIGDLHILVNSRLTELLKSTDKTARAEGKAEGIEAERERSPNSSVSKG